MNFIVVWKILGNGIGKVINKDKIFKKYIEIEFELGEIDRCWRLYEKYFEWFFDNCYVWCKYVEFEILFEEMERVRGIFEFVVF